MTFYGTYQSQRMKGGMKMKNKILKKEQVQVTPEQIQRLQELEYQNYLNSLLDEKTFRMTMIQELRTITKAIQKLEQTIEKVSLEEGAESPTVSKIKKIEPDDDPDDMSDEDQDDDDSDSDSDSEMEDEDDPIEFEKPRKRGRPKR